VISPIVEALEANRILFANIFGDADASLGYLCKLRWEEGLATGVLGII